MPQPADHIFIEQVLGGNHHAFAMLVDRYKDMAFTIAYRIAKNREEAEEVAQDAFLKAFKSLDTFKKESKFSTWLYTIVYNTAVSKTRKRKLATSDVDDIALENVSWEDSVSQLDRMNTGDQQQFIRQAIQQLPQDEAALITLYYMDEQQVSEISEVTGFSISNVKIKLHRARKRLHFELQRLLQHELSEIL